MNGLHILKRCWQAMPLSDHNRWRITSLLLEPILPLIRGSVVHSAYLREKEWQSKRIRPFHGDALPLLPQQEKPDIIIWGIIDWRFRIQRPQHLARGFAAAAHRVFYVSTAFVNTNRPGFELESMDNDGRLFSVRLHLKGRPAVYAAPPTRDDLKRIRASLAKLLDWTQSQEIVTIVQHPYWHELARKLPNSRLIYDCMDHHDGFGNTGAGIAALELSLLKEAEAVVTTSQSLRDIAAQHNHNVALIRNGAEYEFFSAVPAAAFKDPQGRRVIGYYGAIAEWMDVDLLEKLASRFHDCLLLLVGADECGARQRLTPLANVLFTGEVRYTELPYYLYGIDVCLLPFRVTPLTLATNPVKVYEYLAAGKPVVAIDLPELTLFGGQVVTATTHEDFLASVEVALASPAAPDAVAARRAFAVRNSWRERVAAFESVIAALPDPLVSVIVLTYNNLDLTRACLDSLERYTGYGNYEVIVVDNASTDGTPMFLKGWAEAGTGRHVILNAINRGFSAANNQGLKKAQGEYLLLLNNDTEVTPGWLRTLMNHLRLDHTIGLIGPVANNIGNEARIRISYAEPYEMQRKARKHTLQHLGETFRIRTLAFFCVMLPRRVYAQAGPLDESYGLGFFEDDDYCRRVEQAGWRIECAEDVFIHHHQSASFNKLGKGRKELFERNRKIYEAKWGPWIPHKHRRESGMSIIDRLYRLPTSLRGRESVLLDRFVRQRGDQGHMAHFRCNVCGRRSAVAQTRLSREQVSCVCGSTVRQRALIHVLSLELYGKSLALPDFPHRPDLVGIDMSGAATYAAGLAHKLGYTNTFLHRSPRLDITDPDPGWLERCDFVISSDVFEHVTPPVGRAFDNALRLLKPGGLFVLTVPYAKAGANIEHFPELHDWYVEAYEGRRVLINMTTDGRRQQFHNLIFHGGEGETLEMRVFSEMGVLGELRRAGFTEIRIHDEPCMAHGIVWPQNWSLPISARRPDGMR